MAEDRSMYLGYGKKSHNKDNKEQRHVVKESVTHFTLKVPAFTDKGKTFIGWAKVVLAKVNPEGLAAVKAALTQPDVKDLNRQKVTDIRNNLARSYELKALLAKVVAGKATPAEVSKVFAAQAKVDPKLAKEAEAILLKALKA